MTKFDHAFQQNVIFLSVVYVVISRILRLGLIFGEKVIVDRCFNYMVVHNFKFFYILWTSFPQ